MSNSSQSDPWSDPVNLILGIAVIVVALALVVGGFVMMRGSGESSVARPSGSVFGGIPRDREPLAPAPPPLSNQDSTQLAATSKPAAPAPVLAAPSGNRAREKAFLAQHDGEIRQCQDRLRELGMRYHAKSALVRQIDAEFAGMDRYMALKKRYEADRDAYAWARDTIALPEVRQTIRKYVTKPEAWSVFSDIMIEALKEPPPKAVYDEMRNFVKRDPSVTDYASELTQAIGENSQAVFNSLSGKNSKALHELALDLGTQRPSSTKSP
ncbi:MAG: hypothetical protein HY927_01925 [Elusimicrobia bacterium]|nr:hypothetical protein [Elusimicrobiota bacterium]